jgi:hypothetical protein
MIGSEIDLTELVDLGLGQQKNRGKQTNALVSRPNQKIDTDSGDR